MVGQNKTLSGKEKCSDERIASAVARRRKFEEPEAMAQCDLAEPKISESSLESENSDTPNDTEFQAAAWFRRFEADQTKKNRDQRCRCHAG